MRKTTAAVLVAFIVALSAMANAPVHSNDICMLLLSKVKISEQPIEEEGEQGRRMPGIKFECLIDSNGIQFSNGATPQFMSYEVYDMDEMPVTSFMSESEFISYIFSHEGDWMIRLIATDCAYVGVVSI